MRQARAGLIRKDDITGQTTARPVDMQFLKMENHLKIKYVLVTAMLPKEELLYFLKFAFPTSLTQSQNDYFRFEALTLSNQSMA